MSTSLQRACQAAIAWLRAMRRPAISVLILACAIISALPSQAGTGAVPDAAAETRAAPAHAGSPAPAQLHAPTGTPAAKALLPRDLTPIGMFLAADLVVKAVMVGLAFASVATWTVWLAKTLELLAATRRLRTALGSLEDARSLNEAMLRVGQRAGDASDLLRNAAAEFELSGGLSRDGVKERIASRFERVEARAGRRTARGTGVLATIGSTAPFVGLFGTVWGIMNSFIGISQAQTTNLAVVAPGIAEALLATAIGLVAAIPAVMIYNALARAITGYRGLLADASAATLRLVSRDLDGGMRVRQAAE